MSQQGFAELVIVTGMSGSGKSVALKTLEDLGYYCVDNLPSSLLEEFMQQFAQDPDAQHHIALGLDIRSRLKHQSTDIPALLEGLKSKYPQMQILCLSASDDTLIKRYSETRRRHPLAGSDNPLAHAIASERGWLAPLQDIADLALDTSNLSIHQLRREIVNTLNLGDQPLVTLVESFAFKRGVPSDLDFAFDVRCLPNPHWVPELRSLTGREEPVAKYLGSDRTVCAMVDDIYGFLDRWIACFESDQRSYLTIGIGCTGGKHRSVYVTEQIAERLRESGRQIMTYHRELI